ncbi:MAG TPA: phosphoenolpyruvate carboxylase [Ktedonobacterales bacterium]|nr:phosphoenolpyruvate carboxylase [Ktedonobacterales bacterium]
MTETGELPEPSQTAGAPARAIERGAPLATMDALREDVHTLGDLVGQVVREQAGDRIFGLGSALEEEISGGGLEQLRAMYAGWRFFATAMDNAQRSLGIADMPTVRRYASLVPAGNAHFELLRAEYARSVRTVLQITQQQALLERSSVLARSIRLRNPYVDALHVAQIALLRRYRTPGDASRPEDSAMLLDAIHHSINGIAAGLQETG